MNLFSKWASPSRICFGPFGSLLLDVGAGRLEVAQQVLHDHTFRPRAPRYSLAAVPGEYRVPQEAINAASDNFPRLLRPCRHIARFVDIIGCTTMVYNAEQRSDSEVVIYSRRP